jgi:hypothetical protein
MLSHLRNSDGQVNHLEQGVILPIGKQGAWRRKVMASKNAVRNEAPDRTTGPLQILRNATSALLMLFLSFVPAAAADTGLQAAAREIGEIINDCIWKIEKAVPAAERVTDVVISPIDPSKFGKHLDEDAAGLILDEVTREIAGMKSLKVIGVVGRSFLLEFEHTLHGSKGIEEIQKALRDVSYDYLIVPVPSFNKDGVVIMHFLVKKRDFKCDSSTKPLPVRFDITSGIVIKRGIYPVEVLRRLVEKFLSERADVQRITILPTVNGAVVLDKILRDNLEEQLVRLFNEPTVPRALEINRLWEGKFTYGDAQPGDWLAQISFGSRQPVKMRVAIWRRLGGMVFEEADEVYIERLDQYLSGPGDIVLGFDTVSPASRFELPRFTLQTQRDIDVYCLGYTLDGEATLLLPLPRAPGEPAVARLRGRAQPYRFPADFMPQPMPPRATRRDLLHDGIVVCWTTPTGAPDTAHRSWSEYGREFLDKWKSARRAPMFQGEVSLLMRQLREGHVSEMFFVNGDGRQ